MSQRKCKVKPCKSNDEVKNESLLVTAGTNTKSLDTHYTVHGCNNNSINYASFAKEISQKILKDLKKEFSFGQENEIQRNLDKVEWKGTIESLDSFEEDLIEYGFIEKNSDFKKIFYLGENTEDLDVNSEGQIKVVWLKRKCWLPVMIDYLSRRQMIYIKGDKLHKICSTYFTRIESEEFIPFDSGNLRRGLHKAKIGKHKKKTFELIYGIVDDCHIKFFKRTVSN